MGYTSGNPVSRMHDLQVGNHQKLGLIGAWDGTKDDERALHERFAHYRVQGEWFLPAEDLLEFIHARRQEKNWTVPGEPWLTDDVRRSRAEYRRNYMREYMRRRRAK